MARQLCLASGGLQGLHADSCPVLRRLPLSCVSLMPLATSRQMGIHHQGCTHSPCCPRGEGPCWVLALKPGRKGHASVVAITNYRPCLGVSSSQQTLDQRWQQAPSCSM
jgi:hypothetical protein